MQSKTELLTSAKSFMQTLALECEAQTCILSNYERLLANEESYAAFSAILNAYGTGGEDVDFTALCGEMKSLAEKNGVHPMTGYLLMYISMLPLLQRKYEEKGIPEDIFFATIPDLRYKMTEGYLVDGVYGISEGAATGWYPSIFRARTLTFCRLQFVFSKACFECEVDGVKVEKDTPVLHIHIPRTGTKIDRESILASYRRAAEYYAPFFGENPIVMTTRTWMFFPRHAEFLPESSNMMQFYYDFRLVDSGEYEDYSQLWRLFDCRYTGDVDALPQNTTLRRAYADLVRRGEKTGWGRGVMIYRG